MNQTIFLQGVADGPNVRMLLIAAANDGGGYVLDTLRLCLFVGLFVSGEIWLKHLAKAIDVTQLKADSYFCCCHLSNTKKKSTEALAEVCGLWAYF